MMSLQLSPAEVSEDCLYLNVYVPAEAARGDRLPVRPHTLLAVTTATGAGGHAGYHGYHGCSFHQLSLS